MIRLHQICSYMLFLESLTQKLWQHVLTGEKKTQLLGQSFKKQYTYTSFKIISIFLSEQVRIHRQALGNAPNLQDLKIHKKNITLQIMKSPWMKGEDYIFLYLFVIIHSLTVLHRINARAFFKFLRFLGDVYSI